MHIKLLVMSAFVLSSVTTIASVHLGKKALNGRIGARDDYHSQNVSRDRVSTLFEKYDKSMSQEQITSRLDALALYLKENRSFRAYIISYGGRLSCRGEALERGRSAKDYLSKVRGIHRQRIRTFDGGFQEEWTVELWTGAEGAFPPTPAPTIDRHEVRILKNCKPRSSGKVRVS